MSEVSSKAKWLPCWNMDEWLFMHNHWVSPTGWDLISGGRCQWEEEELRAAPRKSSRFTFNLQLCSGKSQKRHKPFLLCHSNGISSENVQCFISRAYSKKPKWLNVGRIRSEGAPAVCRFAETRLQPLLNKLGVFNQAHILFARQSRSANCSGV